MSTLPRTPHGDIDVAVLRDVPVLDRAVRRRATNMLYGTGLRRVQVGVGDLPLKDPVGILEASAVRPIVKLSQPGRVGCRAQAITHGPLRDQTDTDLLLSLSQVLDRAADGGEHGIRFISGFGDSRWVAYDQIRDRAARIAGGLREAGIKASQPVLIQCGDHEQFLLAFWGCQMVAAVPVPCTAPSTGFTDAVNERLEGVWRTLERAPVITDDVGRLPEGIRATGLIMSMDDLEQSAPIEAVAVSGTATALMLLTSGSTGTPKLVTQTHQAVLHAVIGMQQDNGLAEEDVSLNWFPLDHVVGLLMCNIRDTWTRCEQIHVSTSLVLSEPLVWVDLLSQHSVTITWAPNFAYSLVASREAEFLGRGWDLSSLRVIINGGEMVVAEQTTHFLRVLAPFGLRGTAMQPMWGMSETCSGVTYSHTHVALPGSTAELDTGPVSVGRPISGLSLRIVDDAGRVVAEREEGHLEVAGVVVTRGYFNNAKANADSFTEDGWFRTGDRAFLDDGALTLAGRTKDVILINGVNTPATEIETIADRVGGVRASFTSAVAYRSAGAATDELVIFFSPDDGKDSRRISRLISQKVNQHFGFAVKQVIPVAPHEIPKTAIGKIQRSQLAERLRAGEFRMNTNDRGRSDPPGVWLSRPTWLPAHAAPFGSRERRHFDVIGMEQPDFHRLSLLLDREGYTSSAVRWGDEAALDPASTDVVLVLKSAFGYLPARIDDLVEEQARCIEEIGSIARALERRRHSDAKGLRLTILTTGTVALQDGKASDPVHAAVRGFLPNLAAEHPWLRVRSLDVEPGRAEDGWAELLNEVTDQRVAYRRGLRQVLRFRGLDSVSPDAAESMLKSDGAYVVVGGMGGIGIMLCRHLLTHYGARLLIVGRRPHSEVNVSMQELRRAGEVHYVQADFGDESALEQELTEYEELWGRRFSGAFHLAGQLDSVPLREFTRSGLRQALSSKVGPAEVLADVMTARGAFVVAFSSVNALFGGIGVGAYGAANGYLDAWLDAMSRRGIPHHSILWSQWSGLGMSAEGTDDELLGALGYRPISVSEGMAALETILRHPSGCSVVGLVPTNPFIAGLVARDAVALDRLTATAEVAENASYEGPHLVTDEYGTSAEIQVALSEAAIDERTVDPDLLTAVRGIWSEILDGVEVTAEIGFFDVGAESLHLPRAQRVVEERLGVRLEIVDFFRYPTSAALAARIARDVPLSDKEVAQQPGQVRSAEAVPTADKHGYESAAARMRRLRSVRQERRV
ncbi:SDR family NAD(P)-dependent oxidoreductase [Rathayibacter iranicus]|nr:SDR family NAD(P)-dependent oxidoreductase [Rathayibacter iranicus]